ncbi:hypothetical protein DCC79_05130 [bacterium]|nr:MAG: hypothetical protein DCC79_05130 [bacterium]
MRLPGRRVADPGSAGFQPAILEAYGRILRSPRLVRVHGMTAAEITDDMESFRQHALLVEPKEPLAVVRRDPDDDKFFECAVAGGAAYIVSRDDMVLAVGDYRWIRSLSPEAFLAVVGVAWRLTSASTIDVTPRRRHRPLTINASTLSAGQARFDRLIAQSDAATPPP